MFKIYENEQSEVYNLVHTHLVGKRLKHYKKTAMVLEDTEGNVYVNEDEINAIWTENAAAK